MYGTISHSPPKSENPHNGGPIGPPAMINCELRQARKGATVTIDSCAGMWLVGLPPLFFNSAHHKKLPFLRSKILTYISMRTFFATDGMYAKFAGAKFCETFLWQPDLKNYYSPYNEPVFCTCADKWDNGSLE